MGHHETVKRLLRHVFEAGQKLRIDILPRHFYSEIPEIRLLRQESSWKRPFTMVGIQGVSVADQLQFLQECCTPEITERLRTTQIHADACGEAGSGGYGRVEADILYAFIRNKRPPHIFQIGCGVSTAVILRGAKDGGYVPLLQCVEPYPTGYLKAREKDGSLELITTKAQMVDNSIVEALPRGVFFFVDSSHTLGPAGEVSRIILEFLPRLKTGSWIHFHDIYFPYDYDRHILKGALFFQHESTLLHAYLVQNSHVRICAALSMLHYRASRELQRLIPAYQPATDDEGLEEAPGHFPSATYLSVVE
jgi:hypothetical protein